MCRARYVVGWERGKKNVFFLVGVGFIREVKGGGDLCTERWGPLRQCIWGQRNAEFVDRGKGGVEEWRCMGETAWGV